MRIASVWHGKDGYVLHVHDVKFLPWLEEEIINHLCSVSRGWLCPLDLCNKPLMQWSFRVGWNREEDGFLRHSLGGWLYHLGQRDWLRGAREVYSHPLTFEEVVESFPDSRTDDDDDGIYYSKGVMIAERKWEDYVDEEGYG